MAAVTVTNVVLKNSVGKFTDPLEFEITMDCVEQLSEPIEWKMVYIGSSGDEKYDQVLEEVEIGPIGKGKSKFIFDADPPEPSKIPQDDLLGVTVILLLGYYKGQMFVKLGYYVNNDYEDEELQDNPPETPIIDKIVRNIDTNVRLTQFSISWDKETTENTNNSNVMEQ
eukprot:gb/GECH01001150.1/.p1 GENE.gb/GECH01001150.1/~~gb/GECH01001150.1/.p1  ORF type:complete len:169 (+),score=50.11 gb/GECH01001150.1/:1-507(+)